MASIKSISSRESLCSVDSTTSEEEEEEAGTPRSDFGAFLSDSESDGEKAPGYLFPSELERTNSRLLCCHRRRRARKPLSLLASAHRPAADPCGRYPPALSEAYCPRFLDTERELPRKDTVSPRRMACGVRKRQSTVLGDSQTAHKCPVPLPTLHGLKKLRTTEAEVQEEPHCWTEGDSLFAQKCLELQGFIRPLRELLHRLKMGRFDRGLSSFQQSLAMDRIQRIIGVLQKPEMGERYLRTLLQVERMLKLWFPQVAAEASCSGCRVAERRPFQGMQQPSPEESLLGTRWASAPGPERSPQKPGDKPSLLSAGAAPASSDWPSMNLTWVHTVPISNPPLAHLDARHADPAFQEALMEPLARAYGVVIFLQNNPITPTAFGRPTSVKPLADAPACCHSKNQLPGPSELPRCQSLPGSAAVTGSRLPGAGLSCHSRSLPHLPASGKGPEPTPTPQGRPLRCSHS